MSLRSHPSKEGESPDAARLGGNPALTGPIPEWLGKCEALEGLELDAALKEGIPEALRQRLRAGRLTIG